MKKLSSFLLKFIFIFFIGISFFFSPILAHAVPKTIGYQGYVVDSTNVPQTGTHTIRIRVYDASSGGNLLYDETHNGVSLANGYFSVDIGAGSYNTGTFSSFADLPFDTQYFITIEIPTLTTGEMSPRTPINAVAYAYTSYGLVAQPIAPTLNLNKGQVYFNTNNNTMYVYDGTTWVGLSGTGAVSSVFGRAGAITANTGDYTTDQVTEGSNLYFTNARSIASILTGFTSGAGSISSGDTILQAIQKLDGNVNTKLTATLADTKIFVGNGGNLATAVNLSGDATIDDTGLLTIANNAVTTAKINNGSVTNAKLANSTIALALASTGTDITVSGSPASLGGTLTLNVPSASASNRGLLTSADWTTFNGKQNALGYTPLNAANNLSDLVSVSTARTNLGLGSLATLNTINNNNWLGTVLSVSNGGTGLSSVGSNGQILAVVAGAPAYVNPVSQFVFQNGLTASGSNTVSLGGTLNQSTNLNLNGNALSIFGNGTASISANTSVDLTSTAGAIGFNTSVPSVTISNNGDLAFFTYPQYRNDSGSVTPVNFLYTDSGGNLLSAPKPSFISGGLGFTPGSVVFANTSGGLTQNNASLFFNNSTTSLGIGTNTPGQALDVTGNVQFSGALMPSGNAGTAPSGSAPYVAYKVLVSAGAGSAPTWTSFNFGSIADQQITSQKAQANGLATLDSGGTVPSAQIPSTVLGNTFVETTLNGAGGCTSIPYPTAKKGDICIVTSTNTNYVLTNNTPSVAANWAALLTPAPPVSSVNGDTGNVTLTASNGLTYVTGTDVQLGGTLLNNTEVDQNNNYISFPNTGGFGIGTTSGDVPTQALQVVGNFELDGAFMPGADPGTAGQILQSTGAGSTPVWVSPYTRVNGSATGDMEYWDGSAWTTIPIGNDGQKLSVVGGLPSWSSDGQIVTLNGLTGTTQTFATGTSGTDFNISSSGTTHTFNIPHQSGTTGTYGLLSDTDWNTFNNKFSTPSGTTSQYIRGDGSLATLDTSVVPENGNLYFTNARTIASVLTGYSSSAGTVASTDTILQAINKLNGNTALKLTSPLTTKGDLLAYSTTNARLAVGSNGQVLTADNTATTGIKWATPIDLVTQSANTIFAGPSSGGSTTPTFRSLVIADLPTSIPNSNLANSTIALALASTGTDITVSGSPASLGGTLTLNVPSASASNRGLLTSADWTTFNGKLSSVNNGNWSGTQLSIGNGGTGQTTANAAFNALVPSQTSNSGKYLTTDGTNTSWATVSGGASSIGTIDSQTKSANGAVISGSSLVMQSADASFPGLVTIGTQTIAGNKTLTGNTIFTQTASTSGAPVMLTLTGAAHTGLTASTEDTDININLARTVQFATGALTTQRAVRFQAPTYGFVGTSTITDAALVDISGVPKGGTNATITNGHGLLIEAGTATNVQNAAGLTVKQPTGGSLSNVALVSYGGMAFTSQSSWYALPTTGTGLYGEVTATQSFFKGVNRSTNGNAMNILGSGSFAFGGSNTDLYGLGNADGRNTFNVQSYGSLGLTDFTIAASGTQSAMLSLGNASIYRATVSAVNGSDLVFSTNGSNSGTTVTERMRVASGGNVSVTNLVSCIGVQTNASGVLSCTSDANYKDIHSDYTAGLDAVMNIHPKNFSWKEGTDLYDGGVVYSGFIAQDIQSAIPTGVTIGSKGQLQLNTLAIVGATVNAIKEQQGLLGDLSKTDGLTTLVASIQAENAHDSVTIIEAKITAGQRFLTDFVAARVTAIRGYFDEVFTNRSHQKTLCIGDVQNGGETCITKSQLDAILNTQNQVHQAPPSPTPPTPPDVTSPTPTVPDSTPPPTPSPNPDPAPVVLPPQDPTPPTTSPDPIVTDSVPTN